MAYRFPTFRVDPTSLGAQAVHGELSASRTVLQLSSSGKGRFSISMVKSPLRAVATDALANDIEICPVPDPRRRSPIGSQAIHISAYLNLL